MLGIHVGLKMLKMLRAFDQPVKHMSLATSCNNVVRCCDELLRVFGQALNASISTRLGRFVVLCVDHKLCCKEHDEVHQKSSEIEQQTKLHK